MKVLVLLLVFGVVVVAAGAATFKVEKPCTSATQRASEERESLQLSARATLRSVAHVLFVADNQAVGVATVCSASRFANPS